MRHIALIALLISVIIHTKWVMVETEQQPVERQVITMTTGEDGEPVENVSIVYDMVPVFGFMPEAAISLNCPWRLKDAGEAVAGQNVDIEVNCP